MNLSKPNILVIYAKGGCTFWRTELPCQEMRRQGLINLRILDTRTMTAEDISEGLRWCDIVNIRGLLGVEALSTMRRYQSLGRKVHCDYDDLFFNCSPFNPAYKDFGIDEIQVKDPTTGDVKDLWKDGVDGLNIKANKVKFHSYKAILQEADLVTTTTLYLKEAMQEISGREGIRVLPNAIDFDQWKPLDVRNQYNDEFRFGWAVSNSHGEDWLSIKPALIEFLQRHPKAKFVCIGDTSMHINEVLPKDQLEWSPWSDLWEYHYPYRMAMLGLDVAIAPLADTEFNRCKSPLKFAEYTAFGWPVIAQNMPPYSDHIVNGETGLLASDTDSWLNALESLYSNKELRAKLRFNALISCKELFDIKKVAREWHGVYTNLLEGVPTL